MANILIKVYLLIILIGVFIIYLINLSPTINAGDSGELVAAAVSLGVPHNPGYPLFSQLGKAISMINLGNVAFRINLLSVIFSLASLLPIYASSQLLGSSRVSAIFSLSVFYFLPTIWSTAEATEVYPLHLFFTSMMIYLLLKWQRELDIRAFFLFSFVSGLSISNHLQTIMLIPAFAFLIITSKSRPSLLTATREEGMGFSLFSMNEEPMNNSKILGSRFLATSLALFLLGLSLYLYLPIRASSLPPIRWGNPDSLITFFNVLSAKTHRETVVFSATAWDYFNRAGQSLWNLVSPFYFLMPLLFLGIWNMTKRRFLLIFLLLIIIFDFFYTIFLNLVPLRVTPFNFHSALVFTLFLASGLDTLKNTLTQLYEKKLISSAGRRLAIILPLLLTTSGPVYLLQEGLRSNNNRENYIAFDHGLNILRTLDDGAIFLPDGDHYIFPAAYFQMVEKRRPDVSIYDRLNLVFKGFFPEKLSLMLPSEREKTRNEMEQWLIQESPKPIFFSSKSIPCCSEILANYGFLHKVEKRTLQKDSSSGFRHDGPWRYFSDRGLNNISIEHDYMSREMAAYYLLARVRHSIKTGEETITGEYLGKAISLGFDNDEVLSEIGLFFKESGNYGQAIRFIERSIKLNPLSANAFNNLGAVFYDLKDYARAIENFKKATNLVPSRVIYINNLGIAYIMAGEKDKAIKEWRRSLQQNKNQSDVVEYLRRNGFEP